MVVVSELDDHLRGAARPEVVKVCLAATSFAGAGDRPRGLVPRGLASACGKGVTVAEADAAAEDSHSIAAGVVGVATRGCAERRRGQVPVAFDGGASRPGGARSIPGDCANPGGA